MLYLLPPGTILDLRDEFTSDGIIIFRSPTLDLISGGDTSLDLHNSEGDIVLRIAFHRGTNRILFNTRRVETSSWERGEHVGFEGKFIGRDTTVTICDHRDRFQILINNRTVHYFKKRFQDNVTAIAYHIDDPDHLSLFSEYLTVDTYSCLANLLPRGD
jgi:hypothetical protein